MEPRDDDILREGDVTVEEDGEALFDVIDIINRNFVAEVDESIERSKKVTPQLATMH